MTTEDKYHEIWSNTLDNRYPVKVMQKDSNGYVGELIITDLEAEDKELLREPVGIAYGARFGPDVNDVGDWEMRAAEFIDGMKKTIYGAADEDPYI